MGTIILGDNLEILRGLAPDMLPLVYLDPPFNTGRRQERMRLVTVHDETAGDRRGFGGRRYRTEVISRKGFADSFDDYSEFLASRLEEVHRILAPHGSLFLHVDCREAHVCRCLLDAIFGRRSFINEIIWAYDYGGRSRRRWPAKHDNILWYAKDPGNYTFNYEDIDRVPYLAPKLVGPEKAARGKTPTDVWWHTIVPTNSSERTGYPTQKPLGILRRIVRVHSKPGDLVGDFFAGSGTTGEAAARLGRDFLLVDSDPDAAALMARRLSFARPRCVNFETRPGS